MNSQRSTEIKVGLVSIIAIILFIIGISLGSGISVSSDIHHIKMRFPNSGGIKKTAPVTVNGVNRGAVTSVLNQDGAVLITADIDGIGDLNEDASAQIMLLELTGGKKIELSPGSSSTALNVDNIIPGTSTGDMGEMLALVSDLGGDAGIIVKRIDTILARVNGALDDGQLIEDLRGALSNAHEISLAVNNLVRRNSPALNSAVANLNDISNGLKLALKRNEPKLDSLMDQLNIAISNANSLLKDTKVSISNVDDILNNIKDISSELKAGKGMVSKLIYDEKLGRKLDDTFDKLQQLVEFIEKKGINVNVELGHAKKK